VLSFGKEVKMGIGFPIDKGERFRDLNGIVAIFEDYYVGTAFWTLEESGIEFSQPWDVFYQQYMLGLVVEVCDGPAASEAA
jgi:hypothetical protein